MSTDENDGPELVFEALNVSDDWKEMEVRRAKAPGGWLVLATWGAGRGGLTFLPDPEHSWNGGSIS